MKHGVEYWAVSLGYHDICARAATRAEARRNVWACRHTPESREDPAGSRHRFFRVVRVRVSVGGRS